MKNELIFGSLRAGSGSAQAFGAGGTAGGGMGGSWYSVGDSTITSTAYSARSLTS